jgi:hypothetical protein
MKKTLGFDPAPQADAMIASAASAIRRFTDM